MFHNIYCTSTVSKRSVGIYPVVGQILNDGTKRIHTLSSHHERKSFTVPPIAETYGIYQEYPAGIFNPAFTGMFLWDLKTGHDLNQYKVCKFHCIKSGIILYGSEAYVFTQMTNNDIHSYLKILLRGKTLPGNIKPNRGIKLVLDYIRQNSRKPIIPDIPTIEGDLFHLIGLDRKTFADDNETYLILLYRIFILTYMLRYKMPIQRKNTPGNRNLASCSHSKRDRGWYSYLSSKEQSILNDDSVSISKNSIPDDLIEGICLQDIVDLGTISDEDDQNSIMYRDGSDNSMNFQHKVQTYQHQYSLQKRNSNSSARKDNSSSMIHGKHIPQVPTITCLKENINSYIKKLNPSYISLPRQSWNSSFHNIVTDCNLSSYFRPSTLPECYRKGESCGHVLHVDLSELVMNTFYLTMMESNENFVPSHYSDSAPLFI